MTQRERRKPCKPHKYWIVKDSTNNYSQNNCFAHSCKGWGRGLEGKPPGAITESLKQRQNKKAASRRAAENT